MALVKWRKGYKVVLKQGRRYASFRYRMGFSAKPYKIYNIGHVTKRTPGHGPLAVFSNKKMAKRFLVGNSFLHILPVDLVICRCRYVQSEDNQYWVIVKGWNAGRVFCTANILGKKFADEVELIEEVG